MSYLKDLFVSGRSLPSRQVTSNDTPCKCKKIVYALLPYFFFLNALTCLIFFPFPFSLMIGLIFIAWGAANLLFCHCHRCRDALSRESEFKPEKVRIDY